MMTLAVFVALLLALLLLWQVYARWCLENLDVALSVSAENATEGDRLVLTEVITNRKWLPLPWLAVKFQVGRELVFADSTAADVSDFYYRNDLFHILMHQKIIRRLDFTCTKRGYYTIQGLEITGWDILMMNKYIRRYECGASLTVYPAIIEMREIENLCTRVYGQLAARHPIHPDPFSFRGIREYSHNDPMKSINFKASAKAQELMVNVWDFSSTRQVVILLDMERHTVWHNEAFDERAIKIAASLAEYMIALNAPVAFITNGVSIRAEGAVSTNTVSSGFANIPEGRGAFHLRAVLETLAFIDVSAKPAPLAEAISQLALEGRLEPEYWLISAYYSKETDEAVSRLEASGFRTVWVMPTPKPAHFSDRIFFV